MDIQTTKRAIQIIRELDLDETKVWLSSSSWSINSTTVRVDRDDITSEQLRQIKRKYGPLSLVRTPGSEDIEGTAKIGVGKDKWVFLHIHCVAQCKVRYEEKIIPAEPERTTFIPAKPERVEQVAVYDCDDKIQKFKDDLI